MGQNSIEADKDFSIKNQKKAKLFLALTSFANEPFVVLYALVPFILRKELSTSLFQLALLSSLRPILPVFSFYWSSRLFDKKNSLYNNFILAWIIARLPFVFIPWFPISWYVIFCCIIYELFKKSGTPALMEILRVNIQEGARERNYCICFVLTFVESVLFGLLIMILLNSQHFMWKEMFAVAASVSLSSFFIKINAPISNSRNFAKKNNTKEKILSPWRNSLALLRENPRFLHFQCGFMIGGCGLMLVAPSLSILYVDKLNLTTFEIAMGRSVLMGLGVIFSAFFWLEMIKEKEVERLLRKILFGFFLYLLLSYLSIFYVNLFYLSNFVYGVAQSGSHLLWNLSGPIFSGKEDSTRFSSVNILLVGVRGFLFPPLGGILSTFFGIAPMFIIGAIICLFGFVYMKFKMNVYDSSNYPNQFQDESQ